MRNFHAFFIIFISMFMPNIAFAACSQVFCENVKVTRLVTQQSDVILIATDADETQLSNCAPASGVYLSLDPNDVNADRMFAQILSAHENGRTISFRILDGHATCLIQYLYTDR